MIEDNAIRFATSDEGPVLLRPEMSTRHGIISGATGTGKTVTLRVLAEDFSSLGVPVFLPDIKGELSGFLAPMNPDESIEARLEATGTRESYAPASFPTLFWDLFGERGIPLRCSPTQMGPVLLSRILDLNPTQAGVMDVVFRVADEQGLPILDFKDLRSMLQFAMEHRKEISAVYGNVSTASISAILRALLRFEDENAEPFFGEPSFDIEDFFVTDDEGRGTIHLLQAQNLQQSPLLYSSFMLWLLSELFDRLPEVGDLEKPRLAFFFDEAHLLFDSLAKPLAVKIEQLVRMIRSKGVAVFFVTQNVRDLPENILAQLGNRVQHGMRAYTPNELAMLKVTANSFRANPAFDTEEALTKLGTGEALVSCLDQEGVPTLVQRAVILPPRSSLAPADDYSIRQAYAESPLMEKYEEPLDRESAYEILNQTIAEAEEAAAEEAVEEAETQSAEKVAPKVRKEAPAQAPGAGFFEALGDVLTGQSAKRHNRMTPLERMTNSAMSSIGRELGNRLTRGILGNLKK